MRLFELGHQLGWEKSRLSHQVTRMADRGLVEKLKCPSDLRGAVVGVSARGRTRSGRRPWPPGGSQASVHRPAGGRTA